MEKQNPVVQMPQNPVQQRAVADLSYALVVCELVFSHLSADVTYERSRKSVEDSVSAYLNVCCSSVIKK